jgi:hypothetical protein
MIEVTQPIAGILYDRNIISTSLSFVNILLCIGSQRDDRNLHQTCAEAPHGYLNGIASSSVLPLNYLLPKYKQILKSKNFVEVGKFGVEPNL